MYLSKIAYEVSCRVRVGVDHPALGPARWGADPRTSPQGRLTTPT